MVPEAVQCSLNQRGNLEVYMASPPAMKRKAALARAMAIRTAFVDLKLFVEQQIQDSLIPDRENGDKQ